MAVLREAMLKNPQLKLILMSATLDTELFLSYFDNSCHIQGYYTKVNSKMLLKTCIKIETVRLLSGSRQAVVRQSSGSRRAVIGQSSGSRQVVVR